MEALPLGLLLREMVEPGSLTQPEPVLLDLQTHMLEAEAELARRGYDEKYGARPLRRVIQTQIEDAAAELMLDGGTAAGDVFDVALDGDKILLTRRR